MTFFFPFSLFPFSRASRLNILGLIFIIANIDPFHFVFLLLSNFAFSVHKRYLTDCTGTKRFE